MLRFAANLSFLFHEVAFVDRFVAAARAGFCAVEFAFGYDYAAQELAARGRDQGLEQVLTDTLPGDWSAGERGLGALPGRHEPDVGEINYYALFELLDELGYRGWVGCEYRPLHDTLSGLHWMKKVTAPPPLQS